MDEQPGAHTGTTRKYIPGYSDSNIVYRDTVSGNDSNSGATELLPKLTQSSAETAAGTTKKIRVINDGAVLSTSITKPTEMKRGVSGAISGDFAGSADAWTIAATPSFGSSAVRDVIYSALISKFVAVGASGKIGFSTDGNAWTQAATPSFSTTTIYSVAASPAIIVAVGDSGKIGYSTDGDVWTQATSPIATQLLRVHYSPANAMFVATGANAEVLISADGQAWSRAQSRTEWMVSNLSTQSAIGSTPEGVMVIGDNTGRIAHSTDGQYWYQASLTPSNAITGFSYNSQTRQLLALCNGANGWISADGVAWTATTTDRGGNQITYVPDFGLWFIASQSSNIISWGQTGSAWTTATTPNITTAYGAAFSPEALGVVVGNTGVIVFKAITRPEISASIAGFSLTGVKYSGTITAYNCTMKQPVTTAALSTENCRITEPGAHISNNAQTHFGLLIEGETYFTTTPASQNAFALNCCTVVGRAHIYNASSTYFEQIRDCIFEDGITANFSIAVESGNIRGTCTNVVYGQGIGVSDPKFVDTTDYQLQREVNEYDENSPCVEKASYYFNSNGDRRDMGAWSYTETAEYYIYERAFEFRKPSAKDATTHVERGQSSMYWGEDMTPDVANDPDAQGEELILQYRTLPIDHIECIKYLRQQRDLTVRIDYDPEFEQAGTVTVNGDQSAGAVFLLVDSTTARPGQKVTIGTKVYTIIRMSGTTKLVLDRDTEDAVTDNQVLNLSDTAGKGEFQYNPEQPMNLTRFYENNQEYLKGARMHFARKKP